jgi:hypothetical protein
MEIVPEPPEEPEKTPEERWPPHESVDMTAVDPAHVEGRNGRKCIAATKAGARCPAPALHGLLRCSVHAGRMSARQGGQARAARLAAEKAEARERRIEAQAGPRAVVLRVLQERGEDLAAAVGALLSAAATGDLAAAKALPLYLNQALGQPTVPVEIEQTRMGTGVEELSDEALAALLRARAPRLSA